MINPVLAMLIIVGGVILYALHRKGRVKADFKFLGAAFSFEAEDKQNATIPLPSSGSSRQQRRYSRQ
jgi:hypothetical protein